MIKLDKVTKSYNGVVAVDNVSIEIPPGSAAVILGPSGSGKTTLLRLIAGLEVPDAGEIYLDGALASSPKRIMAPHRRGIGFVFQSAALWPHMTVAQNITFGLNGLPKSEVRRRLEEFLESMSLKGKEKRYPHEISGGEARRVSLARTLAPRPKRLLMDEPLTNLDPDLKSRLLAVIKQAVADTGASLIYVTHDVAEAEKIGGHVLTIKNGRLET